MKGNYITKNVCERGVPRVKYAWFEKSGVWRVSIKNMGYGFVVPRENMGYGFLKMISPNAIVIAFRIGVSIGGITTNRKKIRNRNFMLKK